MYKNYLDVKRCKKGESVIMMTFMHLLSIKTTAIL